MCSRVLLQIKTVIATVFDYSCECSGERIAIQNCILKIVAVNTITNAVADTIATRSWTRLLHLQV